MEKTRYYCDKCKKEVPEENGLKAIRINEGYYQGRTLITLSLCESCREKIGLIKRVIKKDQIVVEPQDIKDRLLDVMSEMIRELGLYADI